jgi:hypothetical protein
MKSLQHPQAGDDRPAHSAKKPREATVVLTGLRFAILLLILVPLDLWLTLTAYRNYALPWTFQTQVHGFEIADEGDDFVVLGFDYSFTGEPAGPTFIGAITLVNGRSEGQWSYQPAHLGAGRHRGWVRIGKSSSHPEPYCSTEIQISMYRPQGGGFYETIFPFEKCWR